jgi:hypothetical protein
MIAKWPTIIDPDDYGFVSIWPCDPQHRSKRQISARGGERPAVVPLPICRASAMKAVVVIAGSAVQDFQLWTRGSPCQASMGAAALGQA